MNRKRTLMPRENTLPSPRSNRVPVTLALLLCLYYLSPSCATIFATMPPPTSLEQRLALIPREVPDLERDVSIYWNENKIPFIAAESDRDLAFVLGMVHAHLRLGQMEFLRIIARGRTAEIGGPPAAGLDHTLRIIGFHRGAEAALGAMDPRTREYCETFVAGINYYAKRAPLPHEFAAFDRAYEPWTVKDVLTVGRLAATDVNWLFFIAMLNLREHEAFPEAWRKILRFHQGSLPSYRAGAKHALLARILVEGSKSGSNSFVLGPKKTRNARALIANDPHLGISVPNLWLIAGMKSPSYHAVGLMIPGLPFFGLGRNPHIAWGGTNMRSLSSQLYDVTELDETKFKIHEEIVRVRGWFDKTVQVRLSRAGPLLSDSPLLETPPGRRIALRWLGHEPSDELTAFLKASRARNWREFYGAFATYSVSGQNLLYADTQGNIGMVPATRVPVRPVAPPGDLIETYDPRREWSQYRNALSLPRAYNPPEGFIVSANNNPVRSRPPVAYVFSANDRFKRITDLIRSHGKLGMREVRDIQLDVVSPSAVALTRLLLMAEKPAAETFVAGDESMRTARARLLAWDGNYRADATEPPLFVIWMTHLARGYYEPQYGADFFEYLKGSEAKMDFLLGDFRNRPPARELLREAFRKSVERSAEFPTWGHMHRLRLAHPLGMIPLLGRRYRFAEFPAAGGSATVNKTAFSLTEEAHYTSYGANSRHISFLSEPDENYFLLLGGQDGWFGSANLIDQLPLWREGRYIRVPLLLETIRERWRRRTVITASGDGRPGS